MENCAAAARREAPRLTATITRFQNPENRLWPSRSSESFDPDKIRLLSPRRESLVS